MSLPWISPLIFVRRILPSLALASLVFAHGCDEGRSDATSEADAALDAGVPDGGGDAGIDDAGLPPTAEERRAFDRGGRTTTSVFGLLSVADGILAFDPALDPAQDAPTNAALIESNVVSNLAGCGSVARAGTTVSLQLSGCSLQGVEVSGALTASVSKASSTVTVTIAWQDLSIDGRISSGSATLATSDARTYFVSMAMRSATEESSVTMTVVGASTGITVNGSATVDESGTITLLTFTDLHYRPGDCYPDGGSVTVTAGRVTMTLTFSAETASTSVVTVTQGRRTYPQTLPAYGDCPSTGTSDGGVASRDGGALDAANADTGIRRADGGGLLRD